MDHGGEYVTKIIIILKEFFLVQQVYIPKLAHFQITDLLNASY